MPDHINFRYVFFKKASSYYKKKKCFNKLNRESSQFAKATIINIATDTADRVCKNSRND